MLGTKLWGSFLKDFCAEVCVAGGFHLKAGLGQENPEILTLWKTGMWVQTGAECRAHFSSALPITGSFFILIFFFFLNCCFSVYFGAQQGSEGGLCMVPAVCCVLGWGASNIPIFQYSNPCLCSELFGMCFGGCFFLFFIFYFSLACPNPSKLWNCFLELCWLFLFFIFFVVVVVLLLFSCTEFVFFFSCIKKHTFETFHSLWTGLRFILCSFEKKILKFPFPTCFCSLLQCYQMALCTSQCFVMGTVAHLMLIPLCI